MCSAGDDDRAAAMLAIRQVSALYPSDEPFDPPAAWWVTPFGPGSGRAGRASGRHGSLRRGRRRHARHHPAGTASPAHLAENIAAADLALSSADRATLDALARAHRPASAPPMPPMLKYRLSTAKMITGGSIITTATAMTRPQLVAFCWKNVSRPMGSV